MSGARAREPAPPLVFKVEAILKKRTTKKGELEYLIKWEGFSDRDNTWEPRCNIHDAPLLRAFESNRHEPDPPPLKKKESTGTKSSGPPVMKKKGGGGGPPPLKKKGA